MSCTDNGAGKGQEHEIGAYMGVSQARNTSSPRYGTIEGGTPYFVFLS